jgi:hypothetical protein
MRAQSWRPAERVLTLVVAGATAIHLVTGLHVTLAAECSSASYRTPCVKCSHTTILVRLPFVKPRIRVLKVRRHSSIRHYRHTKQHRKLTFGIPTS